MSHYSLTLPWMFTHKNYMNFQDFLLILWIRSTWIKVRASSVCWGNFSAALGAERARDIFMQSSSCWTCGQTAACPGLCEHSLSVLQLNTSSKKCLLCQGSDRKDRYGASCDRPAAALPLLDDSWIAVAWWLYTKGLEERLTFECIPPPALFLNNFFEINFPHYPLNFFLVLPRGGKMKKAICFRRGILSYNRILLPETKPE